MTSRDCYDLAYQILMNLDSLRDAMESAGTSVCETLEWGREKELITYSEIVFCKKWLANILNACKD